MNCPAKPAVTALYDIVGKLTDMAVSLSKKVSDLEDRVEELESDVYGEETESISGYAKEKKLDLSPETTHGIARLASYICKRDDVETSSDETGETTYPLDLLDVVFAEFFEKSKEKQELCSVVEYAKGRETKVTKAEARMLGKMATAWCKAKGLDIGQEPNEEFGHINTYPVSALDAVFEDFFGEDKAE